MKRREFLQGFASVVSASFLGGLPGVSWGKKLKSGGKMEPTLKLWYNAPATRWLEALPLGNGRIGAMVFGGVAAEHYQLNELTLWAGEPHNYDNPAALAALPAIRAAIFAGDFKTAQDLVTKDCLGIPVGQMPYQTFGDLHIELIGTGDVTDYRRELDLETAISKVTYCCKGVSYTRESFISYPDQVLVIRLTADKPGQISAAAYFDSPLGTTSDKANGSQQNSSPLSDGGAGESANRGRSRGNELGNSGVGSSATISVAGQSAKGVDGVLHGFGIVKAVAEGGAVRGEGNRVLVQQADAVTLLVSLGTSYKSYKDVSGDAEAIARQHLAQASQKDYSSLSKAHLADYRRLFDRVQLSLGGGHSELPTNQRINNFENGSDPQLAALHFQYGRYLLISCSRPGGQPATLQGIWNDSLTPPWDSKYTININTEMNYWIAESSGLSECHDPLFEMVAGIADTGRHTAKSHYNAGGWVCHHNTDVWRGTAPLDWYGSGMWPMGGAWLCTHMWQRYLFTGDKAGLAKHYPHMKGAAQFFLETLVPEPTHNWLVTCPSLSPEHDHHRDQTLCAGPTMDMQILRDLFDACASASEILDVDPEFRDKVKATRARLAPMQIGAQGQLQEWLQDWDADAPEQRHRHVSHLYGLYPSNQITAATPDLFAAARRTLELRGDEGTGWSLAWKMNFWARLLDGDHAFKLLTFALRPAEGSHEGGGVFPNLFDAHPPFQIDGNFGFAAGIVEMLMQSQIGSLHLLPALPSAWPTGYVRGLRARGGLVVDIEWDGGKLKMASIMPSRSGPLTVRFGDQTKSYELKPGERITVRA
ncbi:MAG TPA: glycoside hydrolase family 95 protein [Fimbriimonadaceae bacterium]|jgi:alpha-L-fucosidase 2